MMQSKVNVIGLAEIREARALEAEQRCCDAMMEKRYVFYRDTGETTARTKEEFYGFQSTDIVKAHRRKAGSHGIFYRLWNGRVFDVSGQEQEETDPLLYDQTIH